MGCGRSREESLASVSLKVEPSRTQQLALSRLPLFVRSGPAHLTNASARWVAASSNVNHWDPEGRSRWTADVPGARRAYYFPGPAFRRPRLALGIVRTHQRGRELVPPAEGVWKDAEPPSPKGEGQSFLPPSLLVLARVLLMMASSVRNPRLEIDGSDTIALRPSGSGNCPSPFGLGQSGGCRRPVGSASFHTADAVALRARHPSIPLRRVPGDDHAGWWMPLPSRHRHHPLAGILPALEAIGGYVVSGPSRRLRLAWDSPWWDHCWASEERRSSDITVGLEWVVAFEELPADCGQRGAFKVYGAETSNSGP